MGNNQIAANNYTIQKNIWLRSKYVLSSFFLVGGSQSLCACFHLKKRLFLRFVVIHLKLLLLFKTYLNCYLYLISKKEIFQKRNKQTFLSYCSRNLTNIWISTMNMFWNKNLFFLFTLINSNLRHGIWYYMITTKNKICDTKSSI